MMIFYVSLIKKAARGALPSVSALHVGGQSARFAVVISPHRFSFYLSFFRLPIDVVLNLYLKPKPIVLSLNLYLVANTFLCRS